MVKILIETDCKTISTCRIVSEKEAEKYTEFIECSDAIDRALRADARALGELTGDALIEYIPKKMPSIDRIALRSAIMGTEQELGVSFQDARHMGALIKKTKDYLFKRLPYSVSKEFKEDTIREVIDQSICSGARELLKILEED